MDRPWQGAWRARSGLFWDRASRAAAVQTVPITRRWRAAVRLTRTAPSRPLPSCYKSLPAPSLISYMGRQSSRFWNCGSSSNVGPSTKTNVHSADHFLAMKRISSHFPAWVFDHACSLLRRVLTGRDTCVPTVQSSSQSYVGLFRGVLETAVDTTAMVATKEIPHPAKKPSARASGFVRLEVNRQKKATGCLMLFVDGRVLTGTVESASERTGRFGSAHCRLDHRSARPAEGGQSSPVAAVGRIQLQGRDALAANVDAAVGEGEEVIIRFV